MKTLISVKDIEDMRKLQKKVCYVTADTIITPSAVDAAEECGIEIVNCGKNQAEETDTEFSLDSGQIYQVLKALLEKGLLEGLCKPYEEERHSSGLKVIRGSSVSMDVFDTGNPSANVHYQELVNKEESHMSAGFLVIDHSEFDWELSYEEIDYVIEGTLQVTADGRTYTAHAGDVLFVPSGSKVRWCSPDKARIFYSTYPADWADVK